MKLGTLSWNWNWPGLFLCRSLLLCLCLRSPSNVGAVAAKTIKHLRRCPNDPFLSSLRFPFPCPFPSLLLVPLGAAFPDADAGKAQTMRQARAKCKHNKFLFGQWTQALRYPIPKFHDMSNNNNNNSKLRQHWCVQWSKGVRI